MRTALLRTGALAACVSAFIVAGLAGQARAAARDDVIGRIGAHVVEEGETLLDIARRHDLGFVELRAANPGVDPWIPPAGLTLTLPRAHVLPQGARTGIVVNLSEQRLYYFTESGAVRSYPLGIGKSGWQTPLGETQVVGKRENPSWIPPASIRAERPDLPAVVPPGPSNPLGRYALDLGWDGYVIHGTNQPHGIGRRVSHGCIRLYPEDIAELFHAVARGTPVTVIDRPVKLGRAGGELYLEVHPSQTQADQIEAEGRFTAEPTPDLGWRLVQAAGPDTARLDWPLIRRVARERRGVPARVTRRPDEAPAGVPSAYLRND